jgi:hypothetical protein
MGKLRVKGGVLNGLAKPAKPMAAKRVHLRMRPLGNAVARPSGKSFKGQPCGELRQSLAHRLSV